MNASKPPVSPHSDDDQRNVHPPESEMRPDKRSGLVVALAHKEEPCPYGTRACAEDYGEGKAFGIVRPGLSRVHEDAQIVPATRSASQSSSMGADCGVVNDLVLRQVPRDDREIGLPELNETRACAARSLMSCRRDPSAGYRDAVILRSPTI